MLMRVIARWVDAEFAHAAGLRLLRVVAGIGVLRTAVAHRCAPDPACAVQAMGLRLRTPVGLAAGYDKNGVAVRAFAALGLGFVEVGTVTALPQKGNPRPRLFRLPADRALVNRMGFNNDGAAVVAERLRRLRAGGPVDLAVGVNIGRSRAAAPEDTVADYCTSARLLAPHADFVVINISSPNTPGLRDLHDPALLEPLLRGVRAACDEARGETADRLPLLVKLSPDSPDDALLAVADLALALRLDGIVTTNTTVSREDLRTPHATVAAAGAGGLSGQPLRIRSLAVQRLIADRLAGTGLALVASGGIDTPHDAVGRLGSGADLVEAYTGLVYGGPAWPARANRLLAERRK